MSLAHRSLDIPLADRILVGLGSVLAEVLDDVAVLLAPVSPGEVRERLERLRGAPVLRGVRGSLGVDPDPLAGLVSVVGRVLVDDPTIAAIDLNPVITSPAGAVAVDALLVVEAPPA